jgi:hypothetical protein
LGEGIRITGADDCLHHDSVVERLRRWLGTDALEGDIEVELDVARHAFRVLRPDGASQRTLGPLPGACGERLDAVTLAMALAIDHTLVDRLATDGGEVAGDTPTLAPNAVEALPAGDTPTPAPTPAEPPPSVHDGDPPARTVWGGAFVEAGAAFHVVPGWTAAVAGGAVLHFGPGLSARLGGLWLSDGTAPLGFGTARYRLWAGRADLCGERTLGRLGLGACGGMAAGRLAVQGRGFVEDLSARQPWVAAAGRVSASFVAGPVRLGVAADLFVPLLRRRAHVEDRAGDDVLDDRGPSVVGTALWLTASLAIR